ncbi:WD40 repeat-like protein [Epithele typhae]|uniref:WD40 repeat-like protein n=1 Tax=Epithele typhae TaxID=378194 RepID=UPI0020082375|nr:WD40 repeat-like protein [Epithele typhae]KAH9911678.1 WD40 repeat-like protein [Epithele typhae]
MDMARQMADGKPLKKVRPRRTVDYGGSMGRWALLRKMRPTGTYVPHLRPAPPYIIDLLPPKAYPDNPSTSLCTKFVHTSTNKIRCPVNCVVWTPEARRILTGSTSGEFTLWNGLTFNFETILQAHDSAVRTMQFSHSGAFLASADQNGVIKYFQPNMNNLTQWTGHREAIRGLSFSPDDTRFATASDDSTIRLWSFEEQRAERTLTGHGWDVKCVEWHPSKGLLVSGSKDNMIKFWDPRSATPLSQNTVQALAWSPNGELVASASRDQTVRVFDIRTMKELRLLKGHKKEVCSVAWHPVHPVLVSGGSEGSILHWDLSSSSEPPATQDASHQPGPRATLSQAHDSNVWALTYHPLGHILVSASNDHTTRFWCRERPGDASSVFSGGGEKPPEDEDEEAMVPGFGNGPPGWAMQEEGPKAGAGPGAPAAAGGLPGLGGFGSADCADDVIPGFGGVDGSGSASGSASASVAGRQSGPLPSQEDMFGHGGPEDSFDGGRNASGSAGGRGRRWGRGGGGGAEAGIGMDTVEVEVEGSVALVADDIDGLYWMRKTTSAGCSSSVPSSFTIGFGIQF